MTTVATTERATLRRSLWQRGGKRLFDLVAALVGLGVIWPVLAATAIAVKLSSPGPVFYRGWRTGLGGKPFRIFKFRTMVVDAEARGGPSTARNDPRITKVGRFLRKYKLDELPQLFNVIAGDMSLVGPRPQVKRYTDLYKGDELLILDVRPGITDYASIELIDLDNILGDGDVDTKYLQEIEPRKNRLRIQYVREMSFCTDVRILWATMAQMLHIPARWNTDN